MSASSFVSTIANMQEIITYIQTQRQAGYTDEQIKQALQQAGHTPEQITQYFSQLDAPLAQPLSPEESSANVTAAPKNSAIPRSIVIGTAGVVLLGLGAAAIYLSSIMNGDDEMIPVAEVVEGTDQEELLVVEDWFAGAQECPDIDFESTFSQNEGAVATSFDGGLDCLGQAYVNNCQAAWAGSTTGSDEVLVTMNEDRCLVAYRTELTNDYLSCEPYRFFIEYLDSIGLPSDLSESDFMDTFREDYSDGMANVLALQSVEYLSDRDYLLETYQSCRWIEL